MHTSHCLDFDGPVILVGGGDVDWPGFKHVRGLGHPVIAVDGGADALRAAGVLPEFIIGDMDSVSSLRDWPARTRIVKIGEQDTTDFEKALRVTSAPLYLAFGFMGQRLDHSLAAVHCMAKYRTRKSIVLVDCVDLAFAPRVAFTIDLPRDSRLSISPLGVVRFKSSTGLRYPLDGLTLHVGVATGTSNTVTAAPVSITPEHPERADYLVIVPNAALDLVLNWYARGGAPARPMRAAKE